MSRSVQRVTAGDARAVAIDLLTSRGLNLSDAEFIADDYVQAELAGAPTHGLAKLLLLDKALSSRKSAPELVT
jgi:LDH2 family malate/lactate/ureidoglycolate dehydrogenase